MNSPKYSLTKQDLLPLFKTLLALILGVVLTWMTQTIPNINFGEFSPVVTALFTMLIKVAQRWVESYTI